MEFEINFVVGNENEDKFASSLFASTHTLLNILYLRNCRRPYTTSKSHWIIKDIKTSSLFNDMEKNGNKVSVSSLRLIQLICYLLRFSNPVCLHYPVLEKQNTSRHFIFRASSYV